MLAAQMARWESALAAIRGVGPERAEQFARLELRTVGDLLRHRPRRYEDRRRICTIAKMSMGEAASTRGKVVALGLKRFRGGSKSVFELILDDGTGRLHCRWWNLPFMQNYFAQGDDVLVYGALNGLKPRAIDHPETEVVVSGEETAIHLNRIVPIYPLTEGLPQRWLRAFIWRLLADHETGSNEPSLDQHFPDLPTRANAIHMLHFPEDLRDTEIARQRMALDEFVELQLAIQGRRKNLLANARSLRCVGDNHFIKPFLAQLGFRLTEAQARVLREIRHDLGREQPMRRLLQGDVGSGKTAVAAASALIVLEGGYDVALMAPTEILAAQHHQTFKHWFAPLGIHVRLHTGSHKELAGSDSNSIVESQKPSVISPSPAPNSTLVIGTHALIESTFSVPNLGLVIIDEQHKFGVVQREKLVRKGRYPHLLVMTATPIPRTLGLTLYGDLDISLIDALPPGRGRIKTFVRSADKLPKVWEFVRQKLGEGRQVYVVYSRVDDLGEGDLKAVTREYKTLKHELAPHQTGLVHGRLKAEERDRVMAEFRAGQINVLLATSVIEVGVDVPNATVMIVENADRFGLAQLHQLRGRIGRGTHESYCILVAEAKTPGAEQRLQVLVETTDGFQIAEADLKLRGAGELLGKEQSGLPPFRFGDLAEDRLLVERARSLAAQLIQSGRKSLTAR